MIGGKENSFLAKHIQAMARLDGFIVSLDGSLRWTKEGRSRMQPRFARIGVDISDLINLQTYLKARRELSNRINAELLAVADRKCLSDERRILIGIVTGGLDVD
ncbi:MAG: hypothetical protein AAF351_11925 [Pseudomonadota bacterium]